MIAKAGTQEDAQVRERPRNSNRGPEVDEYLPRAGVRPGLAWCCAFIYWCFDEVAKAAGRTSHQPHVPHGWLPGALEQGGI